MEFQIDNLVLVKQDETYSGITTNGVVQVDSEARQIWLFCQEKMEKFVVNVDEISPHLEKIRENVSEITLRFKPNDPQGKISLKLSLVPDNPMYYNACRNWLLQFFKDCGAASPKTSSLSSKISYPRYIPR